VAGGLPPSFIARRIARTAGTARPRDRRSTCRRDERFTPISVLIDDWMLAESAEAAHRGVRIALGGNGAAVTVRVILARDAMSLDEQLFAAEVDVQPEIATSDLSWDRFRPYSRQTTETNILPANGLVIQCQALPACGITIGRATWVD